MPLEMLRGRSPRMGARDDHRLVQAAHQIGGPFEALRLGSFTFGMMLTSSPAIVDACTLAHVHFAAIIAKSSPLSMPLH